MSNHSRISELQRRAEQAKTREEVRAILIEATLFKSLTRG